jgi:hypothetical protein
MSGHLGSAVFPFFSLNRIVEESNGLVLFSADCHLTGAKVMTFTCVPPHHLAYCFACAHKPTVKMQLFQKKKQRIFLIFIVFKVVY